MPGSQLLPRLTVLVRAVGLLGTVLVALRPLGRRPRGLGGAVTLS
jgi:hypothetical protein